MASAAQWYGSRLTIHGSWVRGFVGSWVCGFVGSWVRGFVGSWVRGFVGSWVRDQALATTEDSTLGQGAYTSCTSLHPGVYMGTWSVVMSAVCGCTLPYAVKSIVARWGVM